MSRNVIKTFVCKKSPRGVCRGEVHFICIYRLSTYLYLKDFQGDPQLMAIKQKRRVSREAAFALLFEWSFKPDETLEEMIEQADETREIQVDSFARELCGRTMDHVSDLDALIETYSEKWKINRISKVTLAVLRMAFCEMSLFTDIPAGATINEAVELIKTYGTEDEASYVNGILGTYERTRSADKKGDAPETGA